jgi:hypothetical protein
VDNYILNTDTAYREYKDCTMVFCVRVDEICSIIPHSTGCLKRQSNEMSRLFFIKQLLLVPKNIRSKRDLDVFQIFLKLFKFEI